ncbi:MAG TPA: alanine racemase, partial [Thermoleophilia bacterium]|nr:alanine racemase [Thermoleophilia bacterium]
MLAGRERALATVDLGAIRHNVNRLASLLPRGASFCAVVKANGYGHGAVPVAEAALSAGATVLGVATATEAEELREAGLPAPMLVMGPLTGSELARSVAARADVVVWSRRFALEALRLKARMHVKFDSGMGRLGVHEEGCEDLAEEIVAGGGALVGLMSHFATADELEGTFFIYQLDRFLALAQRMNAAHPGLIAHAANSAATLRDPRARCDMVRCGIAIYGLSPGNRDPSTDDLRPAMRLSSYLASVREIVPGDSVGYGRTFIADEPARVGIVPIGYADGIARALSNRGHVLVAGRRCRIRGTVSMDQLTVELPGDVGHPGDAVTFIGESGRERILAEDVAHLLGTINYEIACDVSSRVV